MRLRPAAVTVMGTCSTLARRGEPCFPWWTQVGCEERSDEAQLIGRGIASELGMSGKTVRKYLTAEDPEMVGTVVVSGSSTSATMRITRNGHFP